MASTRHVVLLVAPGLAVVAPVRTALQGGEVPLERYTDAHWPSGPPIGPCLGAAFLDYDGDGWVDLYAHSSGNLWHNERGLTWSLAARLYDLLPPSFRYGSSCADYDDDGLPDIATEQRGDCFYFLKNLGGASFVEIASDPSIVIGQPCDMLAETACWADVDDDRDLDLFVPAYPDWVWPGSGGNRFWENLGPSGPGGAYRLLLSTESAGLTIPPDVERPEGAQFCDVDRDGDVDLFSNSTVYQNRSRGRPSFAALGEAATGIGFPYQLDEGALFFDHDLLVVYSERMNRLWENRGDGTFSEATAVLDEPRAGTVYGGASAEDWDQDGDLDLTTVSVFRRNMLVETGERFLRIAEHDLPTSLFQLAAWGDWDRDGDPDCVLDNSSNSALLFRNTTYGGDTRGVENRSIRVRVVRDAAGIPGGLETEFGATVEVRVHGDPSGFVRRRFVASSHGYLQQSEYALTLALPPGPDPSAPAAGVRFDLLVDFPGLPARGIVRIGPSVNPALSGIHMGKLALREITVFRSGMVVLAGREPAPRATLPTRLRTTGRGLLLAGPDTPLAEPLPAPGPSWFAGVELDTSLAAGPVNVEELVLDGQLDLAAPCGIKGFNVALWDVTAGGDPRLTCATTLATGTRNVRHFLPLALVLEPARRYRLVCRVTELRASPRAVSSGSGPLRVAGGLSFADEDPCSGTSVAGATLDPVRACLWLRFRPPGDPASASPGER